MFEELSRLEIGSEKDDPRVNWPCCEVDISLRHKIGFVVQDLAETIAKLPHSDDKTFLSSRTVSLNLKDS